MQANVNAITAAATATGLFQLVQDRLFVENTEYPACAVGTRRAPMEPKDESRTLYRSDWKYEVHVVVRSGAETTGSDWESLEACENALITQLAARAFKVTHRQHMEMMIADIDVLVSTLLVERGKTEEFT